MLKIHIPRSMSCLSQLFFVTLHPEMRQPLHILRTLAALSVVCLAVLLNLRTGRSVSTEESLGQWKSALTAQTLHVPEATLSEAAQLYRICSSRPQRIVSTHGSGSERTPGSLGSLARRHHVPHLQSHYDGRCRSETAPFCTSASRHYYVIALRHILC